MMEFRQLTADAIDDNLLREFDRFMETTHVYYLKNGELLVKEDRFTEQWDEHRLIEIARYLRDCVKRNGVVVVGYDKTGVCAFGNLEPKLYYDRYVHMPYIHVSRPHRGKGVGKELFNILSQKAIELGAKSLYISTHPSVEAQRFYQSLGCRLASKVIPELYEMEPLDIQLEKPLDE